MGRLAIQDQKSSLSFNGSTSYASFSGVRHTSGIFSLGFWVKPYKPMFYQRLVSCRGYTTNGGFEMEYVGVDDSFHSIFTNSSDGSIGTTGSIYINRGSWNYVSMTVENSTVKTYVNAGLKHTLTLSGTIGSAASQNLTLGRKSYDPSMYALMNMSQFSFENGAVWTVEQIRRRMAQLPSSGTVVAKLDEGAGTVAYDSSGNANNGTITNGTWVSDTPTKKRQVVGGNLVKNGDMSYAPPFTAATSGANKWIDGTAAGSTTNNLFGWAQHETSGTNSAMFDSTIKYSGSNSLKLSTSAVSSYISANNIIEPTTAANVKRYGNPIAPGVSYTLTFVMKTNLVSGSCDKGAYVEVREYDGSGTGTANIYFSTKITTTTEWTRYTITAVAGATSRFLAVSPRVFGHGAAATLIMDAYFDDITITPTTPDTRLAVVDMKSSLQNSTGYLTVPVQLSNTSFNVAFWYKRTSIPALDKTPFSTLSGGNGLLLQHDGASSGKNFYLTAVNGGAYTYGMGFGNSPVAGEWTHIAFTGASNVIKGYRDGKLLFSTSATLPTNFATTYFGSVTSGVNNTPALYKDIVIENGTRWTDDQVLKMSKCIATPSTATAYLKLDEGAGTTAYDSSGNGNNGTITAGTYVLDTPTKKRKVVGGNLVYNGDFSYVPPFTAATAAEGKWIDGTASGNSLTEKIFGWSTNAPYGTYSAQYDTSVSRNGIASLKLTIGANSFVGVGGALSQSATNVKLFAIPVLPSTSYTVSGFIKTAWVSGSATRGAYIRVEQFDGAGASITSVDTGYFNTTVDWTPITTNAVFTTGATCRFIVVQCAAHSTLGATTLNGTAWFDDIQLRPTTPTTRTAA